MSDDGAVPGPSRVNSNNSGSDKSKHWAQNWERIIRERVESNEPRGHPLNPKDGFRDWFEKYSLFNTSARARASSLGWYQTDPALAHHIKTRPTAKKEHIRADPPLTSRVVHNLTDRVDLPGTDLIAKIVDVATDPEEKGVTLPGYRYIGPGNKVHEGDDASLKPADRTAKLHDQNYERVSQHSHSEAELRAETDRADTQGIKEFWDNSHIVDSITKGKFPEFGSLIGAGGLLAKRTYERNFGQVYPKPAVLTGNYYGS